MNNHPKKLSFFILKLLFLFGGLFLFLISIATAAPVDNKTMWQMINSARQANGVELLAWNEVLAQAAQQHADEMVLQDDPSHIASNGSQPSELVAALGYGSYPDGIRSSENWATGSAIEVIAFFLEDDLHRENMLSPVWREVGVGQAQSVLGSQLWVVVFGAQPGVWPIFINDNAKRTSEKHVIIKSRSEQAGYSEEIFTSPVEMRIASAGSITDSLWVPWQAEIELELQAPGGEKLVMAEFRDAIGHTIVSTNTIYLVLPNDPVPTSALQLVPTLTPSQTPTITPLPSPTPEPTVTPTASATMTPMPLPTATATTIPASLSQSLFESTKSPLLLLALIILAILFFGMIFMLLLRLLRRQ